MNKYEFELNIRVKKKYIIEAVNANEAEKLAIADFKKKTKLKIDKNDTFAEKIKVISNDN